MNCCSYSSLTLRDWFLLGSGSASNNLARGIDTDNNDAANNTHDLHSKILATKIPRVLILDGGVSTHLEDVIRCRRTTNTHDHDDPSSKTNTILTSNDIFPHRELWSSSLLLYPDGKRCIYSGHCDWIYKSHVDIISTVTYQCHYVSHLWPHHKPQSSTHCLSDIHNDDESLISNEIMDQMWKDGIHLAKQAITDYYSGCSDDIGRKRKHDHLQLYVLASSGCYGAALANGAEYTGIYEYNFSDDQSIVDDDTKQDHMISILYQFHERKIISAIQHGPPDGIAIETIPSYIECVALVKLFQTDHIQHMLQYGTSLSQATTTTIDNNDTVVSSLENTSPIACYVSFSCHNDTELNDGTKFQTIIELFRSIPCDTIQGIGLNCCRISYIPNLLRILLYEIVYYTPQRGIVVYPNSGEEWDAIQKVWVTSSSNTTASISDTMATSIMEHVIYHIDTIWDELLVTDPNHLKERRKPRIIIGGCCRTTIDTIATLRSLVDEYISKES